MPDKSDKFGIKLRLIGEDFSKCLINGYPYFRKYNEFSFNVSLFEHVVHRLSSYENKIKKFTTYNFFKKN